MGSGALCICCNWHEDSPARQGGRGCRLSLPHLPHPRRAAVPMGSDASYNEQALLWKVIRFVFAVSCVRRTPRPPYWRGAEEGAGSACRAIWRRRLLWKAVRSIGRRLLWEAVRFVCAVTCVRTAPRPVGANCVQAQPAGPVRFYAHLPHPRRARFLWGVIRPIMSKRSYGK